MADSPAPIPQVPPRPCAGPDPAGGPRHPRPGRIQLRMVDAYAAAYGRYAGGAPVGYEPLLDALAARYDGCQRCERRHLEALAASPVLTTHAIGAALLTLECGPRPAPGWLVRFRLMDLGAAIALTLRTHGARAAVDVAAGLSVPERRDVVGFAIGQLLPLAAYDEDLAGFYPGGQDDPLFSRTDDSADLELLRQLGVLR